MRAEWDGQALTVTRDHRFSVWARHDAATWEEATQLCEELSLELNERVRLFVPGEAEGQLVVEPPGGEFQEPVAPWNTVPDPLDE